VSIHPSPLRVQAFLVFKRAALALFLAAVSASGAQAQQAPSPDSLVDYWLRRGSRANWQPHLLFAGCPNLAEWQERGIGLVLAADLSPERANDLARVWATALGSCGSERVERWYFGRMNQSIARGESTAAMLTFWTALGNADSPRVREYLWTLMLDPAKPEEHRASAGASLFVRMGPQERLREYLRAFETLRMPFEVAVGTTTILLEHDADALLREVGERVRVNPALADQAAFTQIAESSDRYTGLAARRALGEALRDGLRRSPLSGRQQSRLELAAAFLMRPRAGDPCARSRVPGLRLRGEARGSHSAKADFVTFQPRFMLVEERIR
jgi:hypothetical protein